MSEPAATPISATCNRCGHGWSRRSATRPQQCPACHSPYWDKARVRIRISAPSEEAPIRPDLTYEPGE